MSLCLGKTALERREADKTNVVLVEQSSAANEARPPDEAPMVVTASAPVEPDRPLPVQKNVAKLLIANTLASAVGGATPVLQKVPNSNVITVVNASGPLTIIKTLCMTTSGIATAPQFTLVRKKTYGGRSGGGI